MVNVFCSTGDYALHVDVGNAFNIVVFVRDSVVVRGIVSLSCVRGQCSKGSRKAFVIGEGEEYGWF